MKELIDLFDDGRYAHEPLRNRIFNVMKEAIIVGHYTPGTILTEDKIAEVFNCSRTPVRESLRKLEEIELIEVSAGRGIEVAPISTSLLEEEFEIRQLLEVYAIEKACEKITDREIMQLNEINRNIDWFIENKNYLEATRENLKFHSFIYEISGNSHLIKIKELLWISLRLSFLASQSDEMIASQKKWDVDRVKEHAKMLEALKNRDVEMAKRITESHIKHTYEYCLKYINITQKNKY